jgi:glyoxylase-like metal-dependent hydrolase (beta-lactamase superfamily II)
MSGPVWNGGPFGEHGHCLLAGNPGIMTLDGTNTWILRAQDFGPSVIVDPGPLDPMHLDAVAEAAGDVRAVLLTHGHLDHSEGARTLAERLGVGVRALDPAHRLGDEGLGDGDVVAVGDLEVRVVATPGHTSDSLSFWVPADGAVLTGDTVLGRGTTVVAHPDGQLGAYLDSLDRLHALAERYGVRAIWPGHGPVIDDALGALDFYIAHRRERLAQVEGALVAMTGEPDLARALPHLDLDPGSGAAVTPRAVVEQVYADVDPVLWGAAELSVWAQLAYLAEG